MKNAVREEREGTPRKDEEVLYKSDVYKIIGAAMEVHSELGPGFLEGVYQEALEIELENKGIAFSAQQQLEITYRGRKLRKEYLADIVCCSEIIVELKAVEKLSGREDAQVINYLKATGKEVGLLINFGSYGKLEWKRLVLSAGRFKKKLEETERNIGDILKNNKSLSAKDAKDREE